MSQGGKIVQRQVVTGRDVKIFLQLTKELRFLDAIDSQVGFEVCVQFDDVGWIAGLLDNEIDEKRFQFVGICGRSDNYRLLRDGRRLFLQSS